MIVDVKPVIVGLCGFLGLCGGFPQEKGGEEKPGNLRSDPHDPKPRPPLHPQKIHPLQLGRT